MPATEPAPIRGGRLFVLVAIVLLALNLRAAVGSLGVLLPQVRDDLGMSSTLAGVLTTIPVLCFAVFGVSTGALTRWFGLHKTVLIALLLVIAGLVTRALATSTGAFLLCTGLAVAGAAIGNVMLPGLAKQHFPDRLPFISSLYGAALVGGATLTSGSSVGLAEALGGWRSGLACWAGLAVVSLIPWVALAFSEPRTGPTSRTARWPLRRMARSPLAWAMAGLFGAQSAQAYAQFGWYPAILVDGGLSAPTAAAMLAIVTAVGIPMTLVLPVVMRVAGRSPLLPIGYAVITILGWLGIAVAPDVVPWLFALLLGLGSTSFTWVLSMISQRSRTAAGTVGLSAFVQGVGYLFGALGPFGTGALHQVFDSWTPSIVALMVVSALIGVLGVRIVSAGYVEDELGPDSSGSGRGAE